LPPRARRNDSIGPSTSAPTRQQESLWFINHGLKAPGKVGNEKAESPGFRLCGTCGEYFGERERERDKPGKSKADTKDSRSQIDGHTKRCTGTPRDFSVGHKLRGDTLRLCIPEMGKLGEEGVAWAWSFVYAMIQGAMRLFEIDVRSTDPTPTVPDSARPNQRFRRM